MRHSLSAQISNLITFLLFVLVTVTPLLFLPVFTEFYETPKIIFIVSIALLLLVLWSLNWIVKGKVLITRSPLDLPLLLLLGIILLSTFFSDIRQISLVGSVPKIHGSAATWIAYILVYFVAVSHIRSVAQVKMLLYGLLGSATVVSMVTLASYFGLFLPFGFTQFLHFTPTGSSFSTTALFALLLPFLVLSLISTNKLIPRNTAMLLTILFGITIVLAGVQSSYVTALVAVGLVLFITKRADLKKSIFFLSIPFAVIALVLVVSLIPSQNSFKNPMNEIYTKFPREVQLPLATSWKVAISAFRDAPFLGSGPSTFLNNFTRYKPAEHNNSRYWSFRFDSSANEYLQMLTTTGGLGFLALVFFSVVVLVFSWKGLFNHENVLASALSVSAVSSIVLLSLHVSTPTVIITVVTILAMLMAIHKTVSGKVEELSLGIKASKIHDSTLIVGDILPVILAIPIVLFVAVVAWKLVPMVSADYYHRLGLNAASKSGLDTYNHLVKAEQLNRFAETYRTDLANTNFALANRIVAAKGPSEASPGGSLTNEDKQTIQKLLSQAIQEGRVAVTLNEKNAANWETLGSIYRQISGVAQNALVFSLDAYGRAIQLDPYNPLLRLNAGGVYYSVKNYDLAIRLFSDAVNLKPDFANGWYNLSVALRDKGNLQEAQAAAQKVLTLLDEKSPDYKAAADYLAKVREEVNSKVAGAATASGQIVPPAAQQQSALQDKNLPNVLDLDKNELGQTSTPAAVPAPSTSPTSRASATPISTAQPTVQSSATTVPTP